jgi:lipopolysaccharide exporter
MGSRRSKIGGRRPASRAEQAEEAFGSGQATLAKELMLEDKAIRSVPWTLLTYSSNRVINLVATVALARLLVPADFGLVALAALAVDLIALSRDMGLGNVVIYRQDIDERSKGTVLTLTVMVGGGLAALIAALSPLIGDLFREPRLPTVLAVFSLTVLFSGLAGFYDALMQRELEFRRRFICYVTQGVVYASIAVTLGIVGAGVWSLVVGQIVAIMAFCLALVSLAPYRVRPVFDKRAARDALSTGRGFLAQATLFVLYRNADYFAVGRSLGAAQLGFYSMAYRLGELPSWGIAEPISRVTFPGFSRMRHRREDITPSFLTVLRLVALAACPFGVVLSAGADPFTRLVFGERWLPMIGALSVLGLWAILRPIWVTSVWLLNSVGQAGAVAVVFGSILPPFVVALLGATHFAGITAVAWVLVAEIALSLAVFAVLSARRAGVSLKRQWLSLRPVIVACVVGWIASRAAVDGLGPDALPIAAFAASAVAGFAAYFLAVFLLEPRILKDAPRQIARMLGRAAVVPRVT